MNTQYIRLSQKFKYKVSDRKDLSLSFNFQLALQHKLDFYIINFSCHFSKKECLTLFLSCFIQRIKKLQSSQDTDVFVI